MTAEASATDRVAGPAPSAGTRARPVPAWRDSGLAWLVSVAAVAVFATAQYCHQLYIDTYFDLYAGRWVAEHGVPERNVVTVMAHGQPWIDQQWLAQLISYRLWQLGGYPDVVMVSVALVSAGIVVLGALMLQRGTSPLRMCAWTMAALAASYGYATPRPQSFGYLFVPVAMWLVLGDDGWRWPRALTWLLIPLLVVWANVHGSVLVGAGFVGLHAAFRAGRAFRRGDRRGLAAYLMLGVSAAASPLCTPYGFAIVRYYGSLIGNPVLAADGGEWAPSNPAAPYTWAFFVVVIAVAAAVAIGWRRGVRPHPELAIFAAATLGMALLAFRNTPWFGFSGCLLAADMMARLSAPRTPPASFRKMLAAALAAIAVVGAIGLDREPVSQYEASIPRESLDVAAGIAGLQPGLPVLSDRFAAVGLLWLHPALIGRVAFDARDEQFSQAELAAIFAFVDAKGPHWQRLLRGYDLVVLSRQQDPRLASAMVRLPGWRVVHSDSSGVVLERAR